MKIKLLRDISCIVSTEIGQVKLIVKSGTIKYSGRQLTEVSQIIHGLGCAPEWKIPEVSPELLNIQGSSYGWWSRHVIMWRMTKLRTALDQVWIGCGYPHGTMPPV